MKLRTLSSAALVALAISMLASSAGADAGPWSQQRVTDLAIHLARTTQAIRTDVRHSPVSVRTDEDLVQLQRASGQLAAELAEGGDRSATDAEYARVVLLCREGKARGVEPGMPHAARTGLVLAEDLVAQLGVYYGRSVPASISWR